MHLGVGLDAIRAKGLQAVGMNTEIGDLLSRVLEALQTRSVSALHMLYYLKKLFNESCCNEPNIFSNKSKAKAETVYIDILFIIQMSKWNKPNAQPLTQEFI